MLGILLVLVQAMVSVVALYRIKRFDVLVNRYLVLLVLALFFAVVIVAGTQFFRYANIVGDVLSIILIIALIWVTNSIHITEKAIEKIAPKNFKKVLFTLGGSEANEFAIRFVKAFTGRDKIFSKYESYHGSTYGASSLTGESERASLFPTIPGFIKYPAPHLYGYDIKFASEEEATKHFLSRLEYQIQQECPESVAAVFIESVTGSNGVYLYPKGYLKGVREICDKYGILMVCDEVMSGFLRTGEWFACQADGVEPDLITFAKGVNSAYAPLGGVLISERIANYYEENAFTAGLTYNAHPLGVAAAIACIEEYFRLDVKGNVKKQEPVLKKKLAELKAKHPSVGDVRSVGLFALSRNSATITAFSRWAAAPRLLWLLR